MAQWPVCSAQNTDTDVKASSDGSGWGSSSGCENQGSCVVCAQLVRTRQRGWQCSATVAAGARGSEAQGTAEAGKGNERCEN